jgi:F0F1-type ATP synthase assembly protein I
MLATDPQRNRGRLLTLRYALVQIAVTTVVSVGTLLWSNWFFVGSMLVGGVIATVGQVLFGWVLFQPGIAPATHMYRALWRAELVKWVWVIAASSASFSAHTWSPLGLLLGLIVAQLSFGLGIRWLRA